MTTFKKHIADSELLIVGHGSSKSQESTILIKRHAGAIEDKNLFKKVRCGFLKLRPFLTEQLIASESGSVYVVPCFSGTGDLTKSVVPEKLGLTGTITKKKNQIIYYSEPVGNHPQIANRMCELVENTLYTSKSPKDDTTLIVIGHGSVHNSQSEKDTRSIAERIGLLEFSSKVITLFLDQAPNLANWSALCETNNVVVIVYLFSGGSHETKDIPELMGFSPINVKERFIKNHPIGPIYTRGKKLWLCPLISADQIIEKVILQRVIEIHQN
jgi:sirohydrochlorin cobaltochelatase